MPSEPTIASPHPVAADGPGIPFGAAIRATAERYPAATAITEVDRDGITASVTWSQLETRTNQMARTFESLGVQVGSFVTVGLPNGIDFMVACIGAWKCGATPLILSYQLSPKERAEILELAKPSLAIFDPITPEPGISAAPLRPDRIAPSWKAPTSGGSTGRPKIIVSTEPALIDPGQSPGFRSSTRSIHLVAGPLYHNGPFYFAAKGLLTGSQLVIMKRFSAPLALKLINTYKIRWALLVPTMMSRMLKAAAQLPKRPALTSLDGILHLGGVCPAHVKRGWIDWIGADRVWELYSGTEAQFMTFIRGDDWLTHPGSVGRAPAGRVEILNAAGEKLPPSTVGEIWMRTPRKPTYQYVGADRHARNGWESLGDLGSLDEDGYLYIADRRHDLIVSGGANVYPAEVESALDEHPGVSSCAVIGQPDDDLGQRVHAIVELRCEVSDEELREFLRDRLARYKIPRTFERSDHPVRDDGGKVRRSALGAAGQEPSSGW